MMANLAFKGFANHFTHITFMVSGNTQLQIEEAYSTDSSEEAIKIDLYSQFSWA